RLCNQNPRPCRPGEGHHVNVRVGRQGMAHDWAFAVHQIEYASRDTCFMNHLGPQDCAKWGQFRRLDYNRTSRSECRCCLPHYGANRLVPRRDQSADSDWLPHDRRGALSLFKVVCLQRCDRLQECLDRCHRVETTGKRQRSAHFSGNGGGNLCFMSPVDLNECLQELDSLSFVCLSVGWEGGLRRDDCPV